MLPLKYLVMKFKSLRKPLKCHHGPDFKFILHSSFVPAYGFWLGGLYPGIKWIWVDTATEVSLTRSLWTYGSKLQLRSSIPDLNKSSAADDSYTSVPILKSSKESGTPSLPLLLSVIGSKEDDNSRMRNVDLLSTQQGLHRESKMNSPWNVLNGRCLMFSPLQMNGERHFKFAAAPCGYQQYYICQKI